MELLLQSLNPVLALVFESVAKNSERTSAAGQ
jgi:hypothetical protein